MPYPAEIEAQFWKALKSEACMMLGLAGSHEGHSQPMTAQLDDKHPGPIWFFSSRDTDLIRQLNGSHRAIAQFVAKDHGLFAALEGQLIEDNDPDQMNRLWSPQIAAWFELGKDDPKLQMLRFEPDGGKVWLNEQTLFAGVKLLFGRDPKKAYENTVAEIRPH